MNAAPSTRTRIISEAARLFAAQGIKATTVAQIEMAVGLRKGSGGIHRHFATKNDLVSAVLESQLSGGQDTLRNARQGLPFPTVDAIPAYLRILGHLVLSEAEKNREVALIMLRDANLLGDQIVEQRKQNDMLAYGATAAAVREVQQLVGEDLGIDAEAFGYVFLAPLIYFKLIEWASGASPLDVTHDSLIETWATTMQPMFTTIVQARPVGQTTS